MLGKLSRTQFIWDIIIIILCFVRRAQKLKSLRILLLFLRKNHSHNAPVMLFKYLNIKKYLNYICQDILVCRDCGCMEAATDNLKESITTSCPFSHTGEGAVPSGYKYEKNRISKVIKLLFFFKGI